MKKKIFGALIVTVALFSGCSNKSSVNDSNKAKDEFKTVITDFKPIKPGVVPQLSPKQKEQINLNMNSTLENIDGILKSLDTPSDINIDE